MVYYVERHQAKEVVFLEIMELLEEMDDWTEEELLSPAAPEAEELPDLSGPPAALPEAPLPAPLPRQKRRFSPAIAILAALALLAAGVLAMTVVLCLPYFTAEKEEPPVILEDFEEFRVTRAPEEFLEPTHSETVPATIPPARNPYDRYDFQYDRHNYLLLQNAKSSPGVDVSLYQGDIDWKAVRASGIEFAMIRLGVRGYGKAGALREDAYAKDNLKEAAEAGLLVGAYFYSQALTIQETDEEIAFMLEILGDTKLDMPLVLDWEIPAADARTVNMDAQTLMDIQRHFCARVKKLGYTPMIYFNWGQQEKFYDLYELEEYPFWLALYQDRMTYPWKVEMWQWTDNGRVPGINGPVDLNVYLHY